MKQDFDFNHIGRREPYKVPDGFFDQLKQTVNERTSVPKPRHWLRWGGVLTGAASVAAVFALVLSSGVPELPQQPQTQPKVYTMSDVEQTFDRLAETDQAYIMDIYLQDDFLYQ